MRVMNGEQFFEMLRGSEETDSSSNDKKIPGDIQILAERYTERTTQHRFEPGQFVQFRNPEGLGMNFTNSHFIVVRILDKPLLIEEMKTSWESEFFPHTESDMVVGFMIPGRTGERHYREQFTWSGFFVPYVLDEMETKMQAAGLEGVTSSPVSQKSAQDVANTDVAADLPPQSGGRVGRSGWAQGV